MDDKLKDCLRGALWGLLVCWLITLLAGCKTVRYVPVETVRTDSVYVDRYARDSVYLRDSVYVNRWTQGDTVYVDKVVTRYKYKDRLRHDTVAVVRVDSVRVPYPIEKDLGWWEKTKIGVFPILIGMIAVLAFVVVWLVKKLRKK